MTKHIMSRCMTKYNRKETFICWLQRGGVGMGVGGKEVHVALYLRVSTHKFLFTLFIIRSAVPMPGYHC